MARQAAPSGKHPSRELVGCAFVSTAQNLFAQRADAKAAGVKRERNQRIVLALSERHWAKPTDTAFETIEVAFQHFFPLSHSDRRRIFGDAFCALRGLGPPSARINYGSERNPSKSLIRSIPTLATWGLAATPSFSCSYSRRYKTRGAICSGYGCGI